MKMEYRLVPSVHKISCNMTQNISNTSDVIYSVYEIVHTRDLVLLISLGVMITAINGLILIAFLVRENLRKRPANIMICSQACTDLFTAFVYIPVYLVQNETTSTLQLFLNCYMLYLSLFNLTIISFDRYLALNKPFIHRRIINVTRTIKMVIGVWSCPLGLILIPLAWWNEADPVKEKATKVYIFTMWVFLLIIVISMSILYVSASRGAKHNIKSRRASFGNRMKARATFLIRKEVRAVHLFGLLLFFFIAAYLPILYINFCWLIGKAEYAPAIVIVISLYLLIINSIINPIICIMLKKDYLHTIKKILLLKYGYADTSSANSSLFGSKYSNTNTPTFDRRSKIRKNAVGSPGYYRQRKTGYQFDTRERRGSSGGRKTSEKVASQHSSL